MSRLICAFAIGGFLASSCGGPSPESTRKSTSSTKQNPNFTSPSDDRLAKPPSGSTAATVGFFLDEQDFEIDDIASGLMPCGGSNGERTLADYQIKPWPKGMKDFLSREMAQYPDVESLKKFFHGFYLSDTTLSDEIDEGSGIHIDGLTCQKGAGGKFVVFMNYGVHVRERQKLADLDRFHNVEGLIDRYTIEASPDPLVATLFHELFHVVDFGKFANLTTGEPNASRTQIAEYSWKTIDSPIYDRIGILYLTSLERKTLDWYANHSVHEPGVTHFNLIAGPNDAKEDFSYLEEDTNFISPYSMTNMYEDLASTLEIYYTGTRYDVWPVRKVYTTDITSGIESATLLHTYDTRKIANSSSKHREKICAMAKLVMGESCNEFLD